MLNIKFVEYKISRTVFAYSVNMRSISLIQKRVGV